MICSANTFIQHDKKERNRISKKLMEGELTGSTRLGRQQRDRGVAVMRKSSPRDVAAACNISGRRSPAASAALGPWQDQPFNIKAVVASRPTSV
jgi:hypothetical protein